MSYSDAVRLLTCCLDLKPNEKVLVVYEGKQSDTAERLKEASLALGSRPKLVHLPKDTPLSIPANIKRSMIESDVIIFCVKERRVLAFGHSQARIDACKAGSRIAFLTQPIDRLPELQELVKMQRRTELIANLLERSLNVMLRVRDRWYLSLELSKQNRAIVISSLINKPGMWGAIPDYFECAAIPAEGTAEGEIPIDYITCVGKPKSPIIAGFELGKLLRLSYQGSDSLIADRLNRIIEHDEASRSVCEIGIGTNHLRRSIIGEFDDKKMLGTVHIGLGDNHTLGGNIVSRIHIDLLISDVTIYLDGNKLILNL